MSLKVGSLYMVESNTGSKQTMWTSTTVEASLVIGDYVVFLGCGAHPNPTYKLLLGDSTIHFFYVDYGWNHITKRYEGMVLKRPTY